MHGLLDQINKDELYSKSNGKPVEGFKQESIINRFAF